VVGQGEKLKRKGGKSWGGMKGRGGGLCGGIPWRREGQEKVLIITYLQHRREDKEAYRCLNQNQLHRRPQVQRDQEHRG